MNMVNDTVGLKSAKSKLETLQDKWSSFFSKSSGEESRGGLSTDGRDLRDPTAKLYRP